MRAQKQEEEEPCVLLRALSPKLCVVRLEQTGSTILLSLSGALDVARARMVSPFNAMPASVALGPFDGDKFTQCVLDVSWQDAQWGPPTRLPRKKRS